jgi:hypothetical protein
MAVLGSCTNVVRILEHGMDSSAPHTVSPSRKIPEIIVSPYVLQKNTPQTQYLESLLHRFRLPNIIQSKFVATFYFVMNGLDPAG